MDEDWVVVTFDTAETMSLDLMDAMLPLELEADEALAADGTGWIDGNEIGAHGYELYFAGEDRHAIWAVLEPIFARSVHPWARVELRQGLEDANPTVFTRGQPSSTL
jgi:hypothetical protein